MADSILRDKAKEFAKTVIFLCRDINLLPINSFSTHRAFTWCCHIFTSLKKSAPTEVNAPKNANPDCRQTNLNRIRASLP